MQTAEEVEIKVPKEVAEKIAKEIARLMSEANFKTGEEVLEKKVEKMDFEEIRQLHNALKEALNQKDYVRAKYVARELKKAIVKKKKEIKGIYAPSLLYDAEVELGLASEILKDPSLAI